MESRTLNILEITLGSRMKKRGFEQIHKRHEGIIFAYYLVTICRLHNSHRLNRLVEYSLIYCHLVVIIEIQQYLPSA